MKKFILMIMIFLMLACSSVTAQPTPPAGPIPIKQESADQLKQNAYQSLAEAVPQREATLRITNEEITSLVALELSQTGRIPLKQVQIWFTPDKIHVTGLLTGVAPVDMQTYLVGSAYIDDGRAMVQIDTAHMEQFSLPDSLITTLTDTVNEALAEIDQLTVTSIQINDGEMIVSGKPID